MTNYFRKDAEASPQPVNVPIASTANPVNQHIAVETDKRPITVTPPPPTAAEVRDTNLKGTAGATAVATARATEDRVALFVPNEANELRARWDSIQVGFVDQPRKAVEEADALVSATMSRLAEVFAGERGKLERQWDKSENVSTEDLRITLQRYRSFFGRLLSI
jgi:hypothetical protein